MNKETADVRAQCAVAFRHGLSMNQIYRLVAILSVVTFVQGCEFITLMDSLNGLNAAARVTAGSSVNTSCELEGNSASLAVPTALSDTESASVDVSGTYIAEITVSGNATGAKNFMKKRNCKEIILKQSGNVITGSDGSSNFKINGTREGYTINFYILRGNEIDGSWWINVHNSKLEGNWNTNGGGASGKWNLIRLY